MQRDMPGAYKTMNKWNNAQEQEKAFWLDYFKNRNGLSEVYQRLDYLHQEQYLPLLYNWIGVCRAAVVVEIGCGPCGLAPWIRNATRFGVEPLADWFTGQGIHYKDLGYDAVYTRTIETDFGDIVKPQIILCCNVLDHVGDLSSAIAGITRLATEETELFLAYDIRLHQTELHPTRTDPAEVRAIFESMGWIMKREATHPTSHEPDSVFGRSVEYWVMGA
jgi:hypothetical protein